VFSFKAQKIVGQLSARPSFMAGSGNIDLPHAATSVHTKTRRRRIVRLMRAGEL
jgi:hypothetical protein